MMYRSLVLVVLFCVPSIGGQYLYRAYNFQLPPSGNCQREADSLAQRLAELTQVEVIGGACQYTKQTEKTSVVLRYISEEPLQVTSTFNPKKYWIDAGFYANQEECLFHKDMETSLFAEMTGLTPFVSYCALASRLIEYGWYVHIDAFGSPRNVPYLDDWFTSKLEGAEKDSFYQDLKERLADFNISLTNLAWRPFVGSRSLTIRAWRPADQPEVDFSSQTVVTIPGIEQCLMAAQKLKAQLNQKVSILGLTTYCTSDFSNPTHFELTTVTNIPMLDIRLSADIFEELADCEAQIPTLMESQKIIYGDRLVGGICGRKNYSLTGPFRAAFLVLPPGWIPTVSATPGTDCWLNRLRKVVAKSPVTAG